MKYLAVLAVLCLGTSICHATNLVDAPAPAARAAVTSSVAIAVKKDPFFNKVNVGLFSADLLVRILDANSTRRFLSNPCRCYQENVLPMKIAGSTAGMYTFSVGTAIVIETASYLLYRSGHHKWARVLPIFDIGYTGASVVHNYTLNQGPVYTKPRSPDVFTNF